jgi:arylsulfatase A-like enzyme
MKRRNFLKLAGTASLAGLSLPDAAPAQAPRRPNIIFIFSDDHAYQAVSAYGYGLNRTPNIDRLAAGGMRFDRCLTTNSLCGPSRACVLTGKYSHANGFYNNTNSRFDGSQATFPKLLHTAGYQTAIFGKWHLVTDPTGFDTWQILPGQGQYYNPPMIRNGERIRQQGYVTDIITRETLDWLENKRDPNRPFLLMCHHKAPHRDWEPALNKLGMYDGVKFPEPPTLFDDYSGRGKAEHEQQMMIAHALNDGDLKLAHPTELDAEQRKVWDAYYDPLNQDFRKQNPQGRDLVHWKYQRYLHDYLSTIASVDDSVGQLLDYLGKTGLDQDTIVVYSSDQGFYLGEHGWFDKRWIFEESLRTPLLVRWPGVVKPGSVNHDMVSNLDFAETFLDVAGIPLPAEMQGRSMVPVLKGQTPADWRKAFYYHYYEHPAEHNVPRHYGVVTGRYKLVYFYEPEMNYWELFDLKQDPHEMKSVYADPHYATVRKELHAELDHLRAELKVPAEDPPESLIGGQGGKPLNAWVLDYQFTGDQGEKVTDSSGRANHGTAKGTAIVAGRNGGKARQFDGASWIDVPKSASLNPGVGSWTVEVAFRADKPDGIVLADGGESFGCCLSLEGGKPVFTVVSDKEPTRVAGTTSVVGRWVTVRAGYTPTEVFLKVDGAVAGRAKVRRAMDRMPNEGMQIGADLGTTVVAQKCPPFTGLIELVRLYSGQAP